MVLEIFIKALYNGPSRVTASAADTLDQGNLYEFTPVELRRNIKLKSVVINVAQILPKLMMLL